MTWAYTAAIVYSMRSRYLTRRHLAILCVVVAVAFAPITCVCADWGLQQIALAAAASAPDDCHSGNEGHLTDDRHCPGCGDSSLLSATQSVTPSEAGTFHLAVHADYEPLAQPRFRRSEPPHGSALNREPTPTPVSEKVVLLN